MSHGRKIAVIGLGYVGLPVAVAFGKNGAPVIGFDIETRRIEELHAGYDRTREIDGDNLKASKIDVTGDPARLKAADFFIVTVPTPIDRSNQPDLTALLRASKTVGRALKQGDIVVYESTVYPGATEEDCVPVLERESGLKAGTDFTVGYSPERINPGDKAHRFETIRKVVAGQDERTLDIVAAVYGSVVTAGIHRAPSIKVAEAAKVIENAQRDLNIAFMNELSSIFQLLDVDTQDVLDAASTKWNFLPFKPGLVGGHCIGVDPFYLTYRAERAGYRPEVILAGRRINDDAGKRVARETIRHLLRRGVAKPSVAVLGLTFKENVPDTRNSKSLDIVRELESFGIDVKIHDPMALADDVEKEFGRTVTPLDRIRDMDAVVLAVSHSDYAQNGWPLVRACLRDGKGIVFDVRTCLDRARQPEGVDLLRM